MSNVNAAFGLSVTRCLSAPGAIQVNEYYHASGDSNPLYIGDAVVNLAQGSTSAVALVPDGTPIATLVSDNSGAGTTVDLRGAVVGVRPTLTNLSLNYCAASTGLAILVADSPWQLFAVQSDGTAATGDVGETAKYINGTGSTTTGLSGGLLHESTVGTSGYTLRILRLLPVINNALGSKGVYEVKINKHELLDTAN